MMNMRDLWVEVQEELARAQELHEPFNSAHEGYAVILEELDELWELEQDTQIKQLNWALVELQSKLSWLTGIARRMPGDWNMERPSILDSKEGRK